jgi:ribonuclease Z
MVPNEPPRQPQMGFLFIPPLRIQGYSIAGEETAVQVPELDVCFDVGRCPRIALTSNYMALTHGHMDHAAGLAYYFSQRHFQGMGVGTVLCHPSLERPIHRLMEAWVDIEAQRTPYNVIAMEPGTPSEELEVKNNIFLRAFDTVHTVPALGYSLVERRSKLKEEYVGLPQEKLVELKEAGHEITYMREIPLVAFTGDTAMGPHFQLDEVRQAKILITECTFIEPDHRDRAKIGKHLHVTDIVQLLDELESEAVVLTHLSRRTHMKQARELLDRIIPAKHRDRVFLLMDSRTNRARYQQQIDEAEAARQSQAN